MPDTATYYAIHRATGRKMQWDLVQTIAYSDEVIYDGTNHEFDFTLPEAKLNTGNAFVTNAASTSVSPDAISNVDPHPLPKTRSIATLTVTHGATTMDIQVFRDELAGGCLLNADPEA